MTGFEMAMVGGNILGNIASAWGANQANNMNYSMFKENMEWQEYMSSTQHQREVKDLLAAGLNPLLSATKGASYGSVGNNPMENITSAFSSAQIAKTYEEVKLLKEQQKAVRTTTNIKSVPAKVGKFLGEKVDNVVKSLRKTEDKMKKAGQGSNGMFDFWKNVWRKRFGSNKDNK